MNNTSIAKYISNLNPRNFTNNTQRVLFTLLTANTDWVSRGSIRVSSATSRLRDLRKPEFGGFNVVCKTSSELNRTNSNTTFYKLSNVNLTQLRKVFGV